MIQLHVSYLLMGPSVWYAKSPNDYCTLRPYREALRRMSAANSVLPPTKEYLWTPEPAVSVSALQCTPAMFATQGSRREQG